MSRHAFILGGTGQIGRAMARTLLDAGWTVSLASRGIRPLPEHLIRRGAKTIILDRETPGALAHALGGGADAVIDLAAYTPAHGRQLLQVQSSVGALVALSSSSVYRDDAGRTLDEAAQNGFPDLPDPISEAHPTVAPGSETYSTRKVALELLLLDQAAIPVTILRPAAIHGPHSIHPREWWFVKRMLDRRPAIAIAYEGLSRFHTSSVLNIAELTRLALDRPGFRILNIADPDAPTVADIGSAIASHMEYAGTLVPFATTGFPATIGRTPWSVPLPFVLDIGAAYALGYAPATDYARCVRTICDALMNSANVSDWHTRFPILAAYPYDLFDYDAEDRALALVR